MRLLPVQRIGADARLHCGDARLVLPSLPAHSVYTTVTSPPYWGLRDYGVAPSVWGGDVRCPHAWGAAGKSPSRNRNKATGGIHEGRKAGSMPVQLHPSTGQFCGECGAWFGCLGLEPTPELYVAHLVLVFREVRRVLRDDGTLWLNLGDSYASGGGHTAQGKTSQRKGRANVEHQKGQTKTPAGYKSKDMVGIPWAVAFALRADGWYLRSEIIWAKTAPMPESVTDRPTKAHEHIFLLTKQPDYYYDYAAVAETARTLPHAGQHLTPDPSLLDHGQRADPQRVWGRYGKRNKWSVWRVGLEPYAGAHFAVFPPKLIEPCVLAGAPRGGTVLDPFTGSGTTGEVALSHGRRFVGIELNPAYCRLAKTRIGAAAVRAAGALFKE